MAIFSRRTLQRLINENAKFLRRKQTKDHVARLNSVDKDPLAAEWEVVLLNAFSKLGRVDHEYELGTSKPDMYFISIVDEKQTFIADITTVSDQGIDRQNPVRALNDEMRAILNGRGLRVDSFSLWVAGNPEIQSDGMPKIKLKIPPRSRFKQVVFNDNFLRFLDNVAEASRERLAYVIKDNHTDISITYDPNQLYGGWGHPVYNQITSLTKNIIYVRLEDKAGQVRNAQYAGPLGIILCDGGCSLLSRKSALANPTLDDVIKRFLSDYPEIIAFKINILAKLALGRLELLIKNK